MKSGSEDEGLRMEMSPSFATLKEVENEHTSSKEGSVDTGINEIEVLRENIAKNAVSPVEMGPMGRNATVPADESVKGATETSTFRKLSQKGRST